MEQALYKAGIKPKFSKEEKLVIESSQMAREILLVQIKISKLREYVDTIDVNQPVEELAKSFRFISDYLADIKIE